MEEEDGWTNAEADDTVTERRDGSIIASQHLQHIKLAHYYLLEFINALALPTNELYHTVLHEPP